ncbi:phage tail tape measure protein [Chromobacterium amazonense]|uniref:Phage tail tape measure protein n=1 Tax=Chromobacterium amazonense TaxID=1382803 RepID=A0A2S9X7P2_9NEIS|nr:phage tail tape measure protein [Chromobacterium amazonense]PRP71742.1 phage tail tape measure protein [Chromobacterium amazonense]
MNSKLKIEVLLAAVDKLTRPLKQAMAGNQALARAVKESRDQLKQLQAAQGSIDAFRKLTKESKDTGQALAGARQRLEAVRQQMEQAGGASIKLSREYAAAERAVDKLSMAHRKRLDAARAASAALQKEGIDTRQLSATETTLAARIQETNRALEARQGKLDAFARRQRLLNEAQQRYSQHIAVRDKIAGTGVKAVAGGAAIGGAMAVPVMAYAQAEDASTQLKGAMMVKDGSVSGEFAKITELANRLGDKLPGTTADFQNMMTMLIRQGMGAKAILGGTGEAAAYLGVQLKLTPEAAAEFAAKMQDATGAAEKDMMGVMDVIQRTFYVGVDPSNMLNGFAKLSPALAMIKQQGLEGAKAMAPLLAMADQKNLVGESAGNAFRKVFQRSLDAKKIAKGNKLIGATKAGFKLDFSDGKGEFGGLDKMFNQLANLKRLNTQQRNAVIQEIWGDDAETLQALDLMIKDGMSGYREMQQKMEAQASLQQRVNQQLGTLKNLWDAASGTFTNAMVRFGEAISPELKAASEWIGTLSEKLGGWAKANPELANAIMKTLAIVGLLLAGLGGLALAAAAIIGPFAMLGLVMSKASIVIGSLGGVLGLLRGVFSLLGGALGMAAKAMLFLGRVFLMNPIGLVVTAIAAAAYLIWRNWDWIGPKFASLWNGIKDVFSTVCGWITGYLMNWTPVGFIVRHWEDLCKITAALWDRFKGIVFAAGGALVAYFLNWTPPGLIIKHWDSIQAGARAAWDWISAKVTGAGQVIADYFMGWTLYGVIVRHWDQITGFLGSLGARLADLGRMAMDGLIGGIMSKLEALRNAISGVGDGVINWLKIKLDIHSPSRVMAQLGGFTMAGLEQGIDKGQAGPLASMREAAKRLTAAGAGIAIATAPAMAGQLDHRPPLRANAPAAPALQPIFHINVHAAPGMNEQQLAVLVQRQVAQALAQAASQQAAARRSRFGDFD